MIDPGHGGQDPGAVANGLYEKTLVLDLAKRIESKLRVFENVEVKMSRNDDRYLSLTERTNLANIWKADLYLSLHINSATDTAANGFESYIYNGDVSAKTVAFQNVFHPEVMAQIPGVRDRGKKKANFAVLRQSHMPALLTENLFIVNKADSDRLKQSAFIEKLATGHVKGIEKFLGLKRKTTEPNMTSESVILYKVQVGAFSERENAETLVKKLSDLGYNPFIVEQ